MDIELLVIDSGSDYYEQVLQLRHKVLRVPLGLNLFDEDLAEERSQHILIALIKSVVVACLMLKEIHSNTLKLRQMAVEPGMQGKNLGATLVSFAEQFCTKEGYSKIELNARKEAIGFYLKSGYQVEGDEFEEVGIAHYRMTKTV